MDLIEKIQNNFPKYKQKMISLMCKKLSEKGIKILYDTLGILKHFHGCDKFTSNFNDKTNRYEIIIKNKIEGNSFKRYLDDIEKKYSEDTKLFIFLYEKKE